VELTDIVDNNGNRKTGARYLESDGIKSRVMAALLSSPSGQQPYAPICFI
jgi:hypothetical protein